MNYITTLPIGHLIIIAVVFMAIAGMIIMVFTPEISRIAKTRLMQDNKNNDNSSKLDAIKELLETKITHLEKRQDKVESALEGLVDKIDEGFRSVHKRLDDHLESHGSLFTKQAWNGSERRGGGSR